MQRGNPRKDPAARTFEPGIVRRIRPSNFPEPENRDRHRAAKARPLDHLSFQERRAIASLGKGGWHQCLVRDYATGRHSPARERDEAWAYQAWLYDHQSTSIDPDGGKP